MTKKKCNNNIKCDVESCKYQNDKEGTCELEEIQISCDCDNDECDCSSETVCESFECSDDEKKDNSDEDDD